MLDNHFNSNRMLDNQNKVSNLDHEETKHNVIRVTVWHSAESVLEGLQTAIVNKTRLFLEKT